MPVDVLIFSKDRPAQLDLLMHSIDKHARGLYRSVTIQWHASSPEYERGYEIARGEIGGVAWQRDHDATSFRELVRAWLRGDHVLVSFLVDDDVFYRQAPPLVPVNIAAGYSMRGGDYDYPFSIDGVVYRREWIEQLVRGVEYGNPTQLEAVGDHRRSLLPFEHLIPGQTCLTGLPWNRVSANSGMPHEGHHEFDLNERFLDGWRLSVPAIDLPLPPHSMGFEPKWRRPALVGGEMTTIDLPDDP